MSYLHSPTDPRHARLFELLRQANAVQTTLARGKAFTVRRITREEAEQIKGMARKSLDRRN